jgi:CheY-like chemotaxis protein
MVNGEVSLRGRRVLVVEADYTSRELFGGALTRAGADVTAVASASEAFAAFELTRPDVLVVNMGRPDEPDATALLAWVRGLPDEHASETPAVAVTRDSEGQDRVRAIRAGFDHYLSKPVAPRELLALVVTMAPPRGAAS